MLTINKFMGIVELLVLNWSSESVRILGRNVEWVYILWRNTVWQNVLWLNGIVYTCRPNRKRAYEQLLIW